MLAGELIFYNRFSNEVVFQMNVDDIDIESYKYSREFYKLVLEKRVGRVVSSIYYTNGTPIETLLYQHDLSNFLDVHVEDDTRLMNVTSMKIEGMDARYESWVWEGILGESLIFHADAVAHLSDDELELLVDRTMVIKDHRKTIKRLDKYTFVNFNFFVPC